VTEQATGPKGVRRSLFPAEWGPPPPPGDSDRTAAWILERIEEGRAARARGEQVRWLHHPTPQEVQLWLVAHVEAPALAAARLAVVLAAARHSPVPPG
jgi:hypothetical protein